MSVPGHRWMIEIGDRLEVEVRKRILALVVIACGDSDEILTIGTERTFALAPRALATDGLVQWIRKLVGVTQGPAITYCPRCMCLSSGLCSRCIDKHERDMEKAGDRYPTRTPYPVQDLIPGLRFLIGAARVCYSKIQIHSPQEARRATLNFLSRNVILRPYLCHWCGGTHMTSQP